MGGALPSPPSMHPGWRADVFSHNCRVAPPRRPVVRLCNEISPALFVIRACIMAFFPPARPPCQQCQHP